MNKNTMSGWVYEIFNSIQGEGLYCGQRQTFIRFAGCNLSCNYCDTPAARNPKPQTCKIEISPGRGIFDEIPNPVEIEPIADSCKRYNTPNVSITGGEPLMQADFLKNLAYILKQNNFRIHLETNGTLPNELENVIDFIDVIAMDIKLPSAAHKGDCWNKHRLFLEAAHKTEVFVKTVVSSDTTLEEIAESAGLISDADPRIPLIIQPVTGDRPVPGVLLMELQSCALEKLEDVRVIPQCHKALGLL